MRRVGYIWLFVMALLCVACRQDEPAVRVTMPISICLPAGETQSPSYTPRRTPGDPGTRERFLLPNYLYFFILKQDGESWTVWQTIERTVSDEAWEQKRYIGLLETTGDSIYQYTEEIDLLLDQQFNGRVYAIASAIPLTFNRALNTISSLDDVLNLTFSVSSATTHQHLQHIYTTPDSYLVSGKYYGAFSSINQKVPHLNLLLYHVAAKVDITWSVEPTKRYDKDEPSAAIRLTLLEARYLFNGNALCFRPMSNTLASMPAAGHTETIVEAADEGLWWEGRSYFYTIPFTVTGTPNYFPLQMRMETNGSGNYYRPTLNLHIDTSSPFLPWLRANFNISQNLTDRAETKTVD